MQERRRDERHELRLGAEVSTADRSFSAATRDVSASGLCLEGPYPLDETSFVMVELNLVVDGIEDPEIPPVTVRAQVQWTAESDDLAAAWRHLAGLRFDGISDEHRAWIQKVVDRAG